MFLKWFIGVDKACSYSSSNQLVEEDDLAVFEDDLSAAVIEAPVIQILDTFKTLFTEDSWQGVIALSIVYYYYLHKCIFIVTAANLVDRKKRKPQRKCNNCTKAVNQTSASKMCDTCLEHVHLKCEGIKSLSDIKSKIFTCGACRDRPTVK